MSGQLKIIPIDALRVGMFVSRLDISWLDSPFISHMRAIRQESDIQVLRDAGVKMVTIDVAKGANVEESPPEPISAPVQDREPADLNISSNAIVASAPAETLPECHDRISLEKEMAVAAVLRHKIKKAAEDVFLALESDRPLPVENLVTLVDSTLDSLARNDQALMTLVHLSRKSQRIADHIFGTFCLVLNLAVVLNIPKMEREQLGLAALLHEAGWTQLPLNLIGKRTRYTPTEIALIHKHTLISDQILLRSDLPELTRRLVAEHHELLDGSGYPQGLKSDQIHPLSQLLTVVDVYEERVHQLTDEPGMIPTSALRLLYIEAERGVFSAEAVAALIAMLGIYPPTTPVLLSTGEKALVKEHHSDAPLQPTVTVYYDSSGLPLKPPRELDLRRQPGELRRTINSAVNLASPENESWRRLVAAEELFNA